MDIGAVEQSMFSVCDYVGAVGCDINDIDALYAGNNGAPSPLTDALISQWLADASVSSNPLKQNASDAYVSGDANLDGNVNSSDLGLLLNNFGSSEATPGAGAGYGGGDLSMDGQVNSTDLGLLLNNFGFTSAANAAVPEPKAFALVGLGMLGLLTIRRRRYQR